MNPTIPNLHQKPNTDHTPASTHPQSPSDTSPPPYTSSDPDSDSDTDSDDEDNDPLSSINLTLNAAHLIQGTQNIVPTSPTATADATKFAAMLLAAISRINNDTTNTTTANSSQAVVAKRQKHRRLKVAVTINCGVTVLGDRNVVGNVGVRPKACPALGAGGGGAEAVVRGDVVAGAKRMAEGELLEGDGEGKRIAGRVDVEGDGEGC